MTKTKLFTCIRCKQEYPYTATEQDDELFDEPLLCVACYEVIMEGKTSE